MNKSVLYGYSYEFLIAQALIDQSLLSKGLSTQDSQQGLIDTRRNYARKLEEDYPDDFIELQDKAQHVAELLPHSVDFIYFTPQAANGSEVYDIFYYSNTGKIKVSCKTKEVEDKSYSFNTNGYIPKNIDDFHNDIFIEGKTYRQCLKDSNLSAKDYQEKVRDLMISKDNKRLLTRLTNDRFIGAGDYYKTLDDGGIRYYPHNTDSDHIDISDITTTSFNSFYYIAVLKYKDNTIKQIYRIDFKIDFMRSYNNRIKRSKNGSVKGVKAHIVLTLKNPWEKHI